MRKAIIFLLLLLLCIPCQAEEAAPLDEKDFVLFLQAGVEIHLGQDAEAAALAPCRPIRPRLRLPGSG